MYLDEYLFRTNMTIQEFADVIGCSRTHLNLVLTGKRRCGRSLAETIEKTSEGIVTAKEMVFPEPQKLALPKPKKKKNF